MMRRYIIIFPWELKIFFLRVVKKQQDPICEVAKDWEGFHGEEKGRKAYSKKKEAS